MGKVRHIDTNQLWVQDKVRKGEVEIIKVPTWENLADTLTKYVNKETVGKHMTGIAARFDAGLSMELEELVASCRSLGQDINSDNAPKAEESHVAAMIEDIDTAVVAADYDRQSARSALDQEGSTNKVGGTDEMQVDH